MNEIEEDIIYEALERLKQDFNCQIKWIPGKGSVELDGEIEIKFNGTLLHLRVETKKTVNTAQIPQIVDLAGQYQPNFLLVAQKITSKVKTELRKKHISYLEANGNVYLDHSKQRVFVYIDGKKPLPEVGEKLNRAFTKTGLKVVFYFLLHEAAVNQTQREIAERAGTALGNVSNVLNGLKADGYLVQESKKKLRLVNKKELLHEWASGYQKILKPKTEVGRFSFLKENHLYDWQIIALDEQQSCWGGEPGANLLTDYLKPEVFTLYSNESKADLIRNYRLRPDPAGKVRVYKKFWEDMVAAGTVAPPLLIYADLLNTGDKRCIETAQRIFNEYLQDRFPEA